MLYGTLEEEEKNQPPFTLKYVWMTCTCVSCIVDRRLYHVLNSIQVFRFFATSELYVVQLLIFSCTMKFLGDQCLSSPTDIKLSMAIDINERSSSSSPGYSSNIPKALFISLCSQGIFCPFTLWCVWHIVSHFWSFSLRENSSLLFGFEGTFFCYFGRHSE